MLPGEDTASSSGVIRVYEKGEKTFKENRKRKLEDKNPKFKKGHRWRFTKQISCMLFHYSLAMIIIPKQNKWPLTR